MEHLRAGVGCAFIDRDLLGGDIRSFVAELRTAAIEAPLIILIGERDEERIAAAIESGAADCLADSDLGPSCITACLRHALRLREVQAEASSISEQLRAEQERLNRIVETIADGVLILDPLGRYIFASPAAERILATPADQITRCDYRNPPWRRTWADGAEMSVTAHPFLQVMRSGRPVSGMEVVIWRRDGRRVVVSLSAAPMRNRLGAIEGVVATLRDVTQSRDAEEALRKGQHFIQQIVNTTPDLIYIYDLVARCNVYTNRQITDVLGYSSQQVQRMGTDLMARLVHPDDLPRTARHHQEMVRARDGEVREVEYRMRHANGEWRWLYSRDMVFTRTDDGVPRQIIGSALDITARKNAEEHVKRSEHRYRSLFESMLEGFAVHEIITDDNGKPVDYRYIEVNPAFERLTGIKREQVVGKRIREILPGIEDYWIEFFGRTALTGQPAQTEQYVRDLGRYYHVTAISPQPGQFGALFEEITQRKKIEEALRDTNQRLEAIIRGSPLAIIAQDQDWNVIFWNPAAERMFGWTEQEVLGKPIPIVPEESRGEFMALRREVMERGPFTGLELRRRRKDGSLIDINLSTAAVRDSAGNIVCILAMIEDITEARRLKERLLRSARMESIGRLAGGVAHEFNNLLAVISGYSESLLRHLDPGSPLVNRVQEIEQAAQRGAALTRQLLTFSRRPLGPARVLDLNQTISSVHQMLRHLISDKIEIIIREASEPALVRGDPGQMEQTLVNLALNARDAMSEGGTLTICTELVELPEARPAPGRLPPGRYVRLAVSDTGCGMDESVRAHIFEPFFTTKEGKGTGLGLSIVYEIVQQCGGDISVSSEKGRGTTFEMLLPYAPSVEAAEHQPATR